MPHDVYGSLTLSDDAGLEAIVTDIPLFSVGIFSIGVFSIFLMTRRVDLLTIYLFISSFLGFIAAILDLGQVIQRGSENVAKGLLLADVAGYINAREVFLGFSTGFIFLLWWTFVAVRPIGVPEDSSTKKAHCAKWTRWGLLGMVLKWVSLAVVVIITILELVWRLKLQHHNYTSVYIVASTLEITISAVFILKICLNFSLLPSQHRRSFYLNHIAPVSALLVNFGAGIGNLAIFAFSETALGRFLRGIEIYTLLTYFLITAFRFPTRSLKQKPSISKPTPAVYNEKSQFAEFDTVLSLPFTRSPPAPVVPREGPSATVPSRPPTFTIPWGVMRTSKPPAWFSPARFPQRRVPVPRESTVLWKRDEETGVVPASSVLLQRADIKDQRVGDTKDRKKLDLPMDTRPDSGLSGIGLEPPPRSFGTALANRPNTDISLSQYAIETDFQRASTLGSVRILDNPASGTSSPVYGLDGPLPPTRPRPPPSTLGSASPLTSPDRSSDALSQIDDILKQKSDLDRSISALRGLHERQNSRLLLGEWAPPVPPKRLTLTPSIATSEKMSSTSAVSEAFTLSHFPQPPTSNAPQLDQDAETIKSSSPRVIAVQGSDFDITSEPATPALSIPSMQLGSKERFVSTTGTQYDVTSFIGALNEFGPSTISQLISPRLAPSIASSSDDGEANDDSATVVRAPPSAFPRTCPSPAASSTFSKVMPSPGLSVSTPTSARGLGSATMSSSFKTTRFPLNKSPLEKKPSRTFNPAQSAPTNDATQAGAGTPF